MSQVLIHIGYPKTGSNFIQYWFEKHPQVYFKLDKMAGFSGPKEIPAYAYKQAGQHQVFVVSEEQLSVWGGEMDIVNVQYKAGDIAGTQLNICKTLYQLFPTATILVHTRGYESLLRSLYSHYIKIGGTLLPEAFFEANATLISELYNYDFLVGKYIEYFGKDKVMILPYEMLKANPENFTSQIEQRFGLQKAEIDKSRKNESLDGWWLYKYRRLSSIFHSVIQPLPYSAQQLLFGNYMRFLFYGKLQPLMKFIPPGNTEVPVTPAILERFKGHAEVLRNENLYQPYLKEYLLSPMPRPLHKSINAKEYSLWAYFAEVWHSRVLILTFAKRDLKIQYAQTYLGVLWSLIQPLTGLFIFNFFFHRIVKLNVPVPYPVFALTGIMGWFYFTQLVGQAGTSLMLNQNLIKKIHFPRLVLPLSKALVGLVEFSITLCILLVLLMVTGCGISARIIFLPLIVAANIVTGLSVGIWLSALTIRFRDFHHLIPYLIGFGVWLTPVFYPITIIPAGYNWIYYFHPMANVIGLYRWIFFGIPVDILQTVVSFFWALVVFIVGLRFFIRNEKFVADHI